MPEMAWYRKYRPKTIDDYIGENIKHIVNARFTIPENRPNVLMLYGTRGCGKTTFARIISKYYLCENQIDGRPCEECDTCQTINEVLIGGETGVEVPGVVEIDATTANGKEAIQSIIEDAILPPIYTKYKILILDECHMITPQAQNSLLKVIEDVPEHLIVIFATTDPEKVLGTIHSRCQLKIEVRKKSVDELADRLLYISKQEGLHVELEALKIIAKKADRVPREAINRLEDIAKNYGNKITVENVRKATGDVEAELYMEYFKAANTGLEDILIFNKKLKELDIHAKDFISSLMRFTLDSLYIRHGINLEDYPLEYVKRINELFKIYTSTEFDLLLQIIEHASASLGNDDNKHELVITTTALRIGKIGLLAEGLSNVERDAEKENKISLQMYQQMIKEEKDARIDKVATLQPRKESLAGLLKGLMDVETGINVTINNESRIKPAENELENGFYSPEDLEKMLSE